MATFEEQDEQITQLYRAVRGALQLLYKLTPGADCAEYAEIIAELEVARDVVRDSDRRRLK